MVPKTVAWDHSSDLLVSGRSHPTPHHPHPCQDQKGFGPQGYTATTAKVHPGGGGSSTRVDPAGSDPVPMDPVSISILEGTS